MSDPMNDAVPHPSPRAAATALLGGFGFLMLGNGMQGSLIGVRAEIEGFSSAWTPIIIAAYFAGYLAGTKVALRTLAQVGHIRVFAALASLASTASLLYAVVLSPPMWVLLRLVTGMCLAGLYVVVESWLNAITTNITRGQLLGAYMTVSTAGIGLGQLLLNVADPAGVKLFILASILASLSLIPIALSTTSAPPVVAPEPLPIRQLYTLMPPGVVAAALVGVSQGTIMGMASIYASREGLSGFSLSAFLFAPLVGATVLQFPVGRWSDRVHRRSALAVVAASAGALSLSLLFVRPDSVIALAILFVAGGAIFPLYSVSLAFLNDNLPAEYLMAGSAGYVLLSGIGAFFGPLITGGLMSAIGPSGYFVVLGGIPLLLALYLGVRITTKEAIPVEDQGDWVPTARGAGALAAVDERRKLRNRRRD
ncbi:MAG: MFS transporter [Acidimicrobiales bacterium]